MRDLFENGTRKLDRRTALLLGAALTALTPSIALGQTEALTTEDMIGKSLRVIRPGDMVTMEYNPERLTMEVDGDDRIIAIRIG
jgi:precorrin-3B methylase